MARTGIYSAILLALGSTSLAYGQAAVPSGESFQLNTYTTNGQTRPVVSPLADGGFVALWQSFGSSESDQSGTSVQGQRYSAEGSRLGGQFQVNSYTPNSQSGPTAATLSDGSFVVMWTSFGSSDSHRFGIQGRRYAADGAPLSEEFRVSTVTATDQSLPSLAALADGGYVAVWGGGSSGTDTSNSSIQSRLYDAAGTPLGEQFQVNSYTPGRQGPAHVAAFESGGFVAVWQNWASANNAGLSVQGQRFNADGTMIGPEFRVDTEAAFDQRNPVVAALADDRFFVTWRSVRDAGSTHGTIQGQMFGPDGTRLGRQFQVSESTASAQGEPSVAALASGSFAVMWHSQRPLEFGTVEPGLQVRRFAVNGQALAGQFRVGPEVPGLLLGPHISALGDGFITTWSSSHSAGTDMSNWSSHGRIFEPPRYALLGLDGKCLDVEGGEETDGTPVNLYSCHGRDNQRWRFELSSLPQRIVGIGGKCLVPNPSSQHVMISECGDASLQGDDLWQLVSGSHAAPSAIVHVDTGLCLDVEGGSGEDGTPTQLFECHGRANQTWRPTAEVCIPDSDGLCLNQERFRVDLEWHSFDGNSGSSKAVPVGSDDSGLLWFFEADNWEMLIKVLDGCAINDRFWVFAGATTNVEYTLTVTDTLLSKVVEYHNPLGNAADAITDIDAFASCSAAGAEPMRNDRHVARVVETKPVVTGTDLDLKGSCIPSGTEMCLSNERFLVEVEWRDFAGNVGSGQVVPVGSRDSGLFWFFNAQNWEMLVKVLDGCEFNERFWMLAAATTDVEYSLRVTDTQTGLYREYFNPLGEASPALIDTFEVCP